MYGRYPSINEVVDLLGLEIDPKSRNRDIYNVRCPFCQQPGDKKFKMNINNIKGVYNCPRCSTGGMEGTVDLYARVKHNTRCIKGVNSKELSRLLFNDLGWRDSRDSEKQSDCVRRIPEVPISEYTAILPAEDEELDRAYNTLLDLPYMKLSEKHVCNLIGRGLDFTAIKKNRYGSMLRPCKWIKDHPAYRAASDFIRSDCFRYLAEKDLRIGELKEDILIAGLLIGEDVQKRNVGMERVPGFFRILDRWCFRVCPGMLIPTRNTDSRIVAFQVRKDTVKKDAVRYITVSSKDFDGAPNMNIVRTHFPLSNAAPGKSNVPVLLTEGPLKADVASHLMGRDSFIMAVPGVNSLRELPEVVQKLKDKGVSHALCAYDMDRISNVYVYRAEKRARDIFRDGGITLHEYLWQKDKIRDYKESLHRYVKENGWENTWKEKKTDLDTVAAVMEGLQKYSNEAYLEFRKNNEWSGYKGIDDFLLAKRAGK